MAGQVDNYNSNGMISQVRGNISHGIDFGCRIVTKFEGADGCSKFFVAILTVFKQYVSQYTEQYIELDEACGNLKTMLNGFIDLNKFTAVVPRAHKWTKADDSGRNTFLKKMNLSCASIVTAFDVYNFVLIIGWEDKISNPLKILKNVFFIGTCTTSIVSNIIAVWKTTKKSECSQRHIAKWNDTRQINDNAALRDYYEQKIDRYQQYVANPQPSAHTGTQANWQRKIVNWQEKMQKIDDGKLTFAQYNQKIDKKRDIWKARDVHYINKIEEANREIKCSSLKTLSLVTDICKISLKILVIETFSVYGVAIPILGIAEAAFNFTNVYLGYTTMCKYHFKEYTVGEHVKETKDRLGVKLDKDERIQLYTDAENFVEVNPGPDATPLPL